MMWLFLACLIVLAAVLERNSARRALEHLHYSLTCDTLLAEPDQAVTLYSSVENRGRLPVLYVGLRERLPAGTVLLEEEAWVQSHVQSRPLEVCVEDKTYLLPRRRRTVRLRISLPKRGWYPLGSASLSAGDFLGLREQTRQEEASGELVILPRAVRTPEVLRALGGFLGDVSVRRFILEDPVLTVGFREYTGREPLKSISWTQSARTGRLMVKQYDYTVDWNVTVLLNLQGGTPEQLEACYSLTRTVCQTLEEKGIPYGFATNGDLAGPMGFLNQMAAGLGRQHLNTILYGLGRAKGRCRFSLERLVEQSCSRRQAGQSCILITPPLGPKARQTAERLRGADHALCVLTGGEVEA